MEKKQPQSRDYIKRLDEAKNYGEIWDIVRQTVESSLNMRRGGMMLFLDDLPIQLGAYHPIGTNNIVLNRLLIQIVEETIKSKRIVNSLIYTLLLHEYLHALGVHSELEVKHLVSKVASQCFGEDHVATAIASKSPWVLLRNVPVSEIDVPKRVMEIVKDFEKTDRYII